MIRKRTTALIAVILILGIFAAPLSAAEPLEEFRYTGELLDEIRGLVEGNFVVPVDENASYKGAVEGYINGLGDPHTKFFTPEEYKQFTEGIEGIYEGVGLAISKSGEYITVISPIPNTPGEKAGVKTGDKIIEINGENMVGGSLEYAVSLLRGQAGTKVALKIVREGVQGTLTFSIERQEIEISSVQYELYGPIGYLKITSFSEHLPDDFDEAMKYLTENGAEALIVDVRNNPGGVLGSVYDITSKFMSGPIMRILFRNGLKLPLMTKETDVRYEMPMAVLVNGGSASASEIFAGAMQDNERGILIGTKTFGKGSVQSVAQLKNGGFLKLTTSYYFTPRDKKIDGVGITPNIVIEDPGEQMEKAFEVLRKEIGTEIVFKIDKPTAYWAGLDIDLPTAPVSIDGEYYLPLRSVFEYLGCGVEWVGKENAVKFNWADREYVLYPEKGLMLIDNVEYKISDVKITNGCILIGSKTLWGYMGIETIADKDAGTITLKKQ